MQATPKETIKLCIQNAKSASWLCLCLSSVLFCWGWLHWYIALPLTVLPAYCFRQMPRGNNGKAAVSQAAICKPMKALLIIETGILRDSMSDPVLMNPNFLGNRENFSIVTKPLQPHATTTLE